MENTEKKGPENGQKTDDQEIKSEETNSAECAELKETLMRLSADFHNYKKRTEKDKQQWTYHAQAEVLRALLPVVDDFERALKEGETEEKKEGSFAKWVQGVELIYKGLLEVLEKEGVTPLAEETIFNPELHEALVRVPSEEHTEGEIVEVMQRGFMFKDQVLRPAKVSVAE